MTINRILFVSRFMAGGGAERVISVLLSALANQGYNVGLMSYLVTDEDYEIDKRVERFFIGKDYNETKSNPVGRKLRRLKRIKEVVQEYKPDIIIPFLEPIVKEVYQAVGKKGIPIVATVRNLPMYKSKAGKIVYNYIYEHCDIIFFQTEGQKEYFSKRVVNKSFVLPNPVNEDFVKCGKNRRNFGKIRNIISAGRLTEQKNHRLLIDAMIVVHDLYPECDLKIYGHGSEKAKLKTYIKEKQAETYISIMPRTSELTKVYENADLFVLSSNYEGMPNVLMEAMAAGMPCISTDCPTGPRELLGDQERGLLVPIRDSSKLADAIIQMIEEPERANQYGNAACEYIKENFSPQKIAGELIANCEAILERK